MSTLQAQPFPCDGRLLVATQDDYSTSISHRVIIPFGPQFFSPLAIFRSAHFDALGFNSKDNYIYAVQEESNAIVRLNSMSKFDTVGLVTIVDTLKAYAGDCSPDGLYFIYEDNLNQVLVFDVIDGFNLIDRIDLYWDPDSPNNGPFRTRIYDFAFDPNNPRLAFSFQGNIDDPALEPDETKGYVLVINLDRSSPNVGMVSPLSQTNSGDVTHIGGLLFSPNAQLYGFGSNIPEVNPKQKIFYGINPWSGDVFNSRAISPTTYVSDGCSCPFSFSFTNSAPQEGSLCTNDIRKFILNIENNSFNDITGVTLTDTFPQGLIIEEINGPFQGIIDPNTGIGSRYLKIDELLIPAKSAIEIQIRVKSIDISVGYHYNQAFLSNLPEKFNGDYPSDDPFTVGVIGDASRLVVAPVRLDDISWEVNPPSDCLIANDAQVLITSPQLIPGQEYEIRLRNKIGWEESTWFVTLDNDQSFLLDSLIPGDYQLFYIRPSGGNCSLAVKDTTIIIEAPNEQLTVKASSNQPVCEGESILLKSEIHPGGEVEWRGPKLFASLEIEPILPEVTPEEGGEYWVMATYGYCEQSDTISVRVDPKVEATIAGNTEYCERDVLSLQAIGNGDTLQYKWSGPDNMVHNEALIEYASVVPEHEGYYEVIVDNGGCQDTAGIEIMVLPSPTINLPSLIQTDYCIPVILNPEITGDDQVAYQWFPQEGLTCYDCPDPEVIPIVQSDYQLKVVNDFLCTDSVQVSIELDKSKILVTPNIFRPLSPYNNELFSFTARCVVQSIKDFKVFDRWGSAVFSRDAIDLTSLSDFWDGSISGQVAYPGVYIWKARAVLVDGSELILTGDITLIR